MERRPSLQGVGLRWRRREDASLSDNGIRLGAIVPEFDLPTFEPSRGDFGTFSMKDQT